jgi:hypothetical protein
LRGDLETPALARALEMVVERHEGLRSGFVHVDGMLMQCVHPPMLIDIPSEDVSSLSEVEQEERIRATLKRQWEEPFDLQRPPLPARGSSSLPTTITFSSECFTISCLTGGHARIQPGPQRVLWRARRSPRDPLVAAPAQYGDFTMWQRRRLDPIRLARQLAYWKAQLAGIPERLELAADRPRPLVRTFAAALKDVSRSERARLYMTLLAALAALLARHTQQDDLVIGSPVSDRHSADCEALIALFINVVAMRSCPFWDKAARTDRPCAKYRARRIRPPGRAV